MIERPDQVLFLDSETRALPGTPSPYHDVTLCGAARYTQTAFANIWTLARGDDPVECVALDGGFDDRIRWRDMPDFVRDHYDRALAGEAWFCAWNSAFDWWVWNSPQSDFPPLTEEMMIDAMAQATCANLPGKLEFAARSLGLGGKQSDGKNLITLFAAPDGPQPKDLPSEWGAYKGYAVRDTALLRDVFHAVRPFDRDEWEDFWVSERINNRGVAVDTGLCAAAARIADTDREQINGKLAALTDGVVDKVTQARRIADWVYDRLTHAEARDIITKEYREDDEDDTLVAVRLSIGKDRIRALLAFLDTLDGRDGLTDDEWRVYQVLELREFGGSATPAKFGKILDYQVNGRLYGQYVFGGAQQTRRFSSRGIQIHNLVRAALGPPDGVRALDHEASVIDEVLGAA